MGGSVEIIRIKANSVQPRTWNKRTGKHIEALVRNITNVMIIENGGVWGDMWAG